jgi:kynurenine formamidase
MRRFIDLSHAIVSGAPGYPGFPVARVEPWLSHAASRSVYAGQAEFEISSVSMVGNTGTYIDSPYHRYPSRTDIARLALESVAGLPGVCLDAVFGTDGRSVDAELSDGVSGHALLIRTGWDARWGDDGYWEPGPFLGPALVGRIIGAGIALVGVDFWNVDDTADPARPAHTALLAADIPIVEHLTGLGEIPTRGFRFSAVPAPVRGAASMPVRAFAEIPLAPE